MKHTGASSVVYGLGFIGALVYFIQHAHSFWMGIVGIFEAFIWPALLVYKALALFKI